MNELVLLEYSIKLAFVAFSVLVLLITFVETYGWLERHHGEAERDG